MKVRSLPEQGLPEFPTVRDWYEHEREIFKMYHDQEAWMPEESCPPSYYGDHEGDEMPEPLWLRLVQNVFVLWLAHDVWYRCVTRNLPSFDPYR